MNSLRTFFWRGVRRFSGERDGASAVEFAIVAPVFLALMFSLIEVAWYYYVNINVYAATADIARQIRTGQVTGGANFNRQDFIDDVVCPRFSFYGSCNTKVTIDVMTFNTFQQLGADNTQLYCQNDLQNNINNMTINPGTAQQIVRVRVCVLYTAVNPIIGLNLAGGGETGSVTGDRRIKSSYIIRTEPYL